ncbi:hypothetical protein V2S66_29100 [Streptomyces sp. V4-01]|uniref:Lipoprotein n=1 Tax=Actinacidiphila polyblastidii TaxID=3110430 RepID=A0ABU7PJZ7_9ACTN|nr:hypothetical protein [Streptomyces sp. V4-01]
MRARGARSAGERSGGGASALAGAVAAVAAAVLLAGCGSADGVRVGKPDPGPTTSSPDCGDVVVVPQGGASTRDVCLSVGSTLRLQLAGGDRPPTEKGAALTEVSPGVYRGARAGSAELSGFRHVCPSAKPGTASCHAIAGWKVTVDVR